MLFFYVFAGAVFLFGVIFIIYHNKKVLLEKDFLEKQIALEEEYYKKLEESQKLILAMRTDIELYIKEMRKWGGAESGTESEKESVMSNLMEKYESIPQVEFSRHPVVNAVAYDKMNRADELGIRLEYDFMLSSENEISDMDLISLMGNLLDNALEAARKLPETEREVYFTIREEKGALLFCCKNRKSREEHPLKKEFATGKADNFLHGLGRKIIQEIAEKYHGVLEDRDNGEWLETEVLLLFGGGGIMSEIILGCVTSGIDNWFDSFFLVWLLFQSLDLSRRSKRIIAVYFMVVMPVIAGLSYLFEKMEEIRLLLYWSLVLLAITLIPVLTVRKEILKYEFCYFLNFVCIAISSYIILGGSMLLFHADEVYFHVSRVSRLPGFFLCNGIYVLLLYAAHRLAKVVMKGYREKSKVQNAVAVCYFIIVHTLAISSFLKVYSESRLYIRGLASVFTCTAFAALGFLVFVFYQNKQLRRENALIKRHREKEMEYYGQLEKNQLAIRKLRHDIMNYFQAIHQMSGDEVRVKELLDELEERVREK